MAPSARQVVTPATLGRPATVDPSLPLPPNDDEKSAYRHRRLPVLMIASFVSFGGLLTSQLLFVRMAPWLLVLLPLFGFTVLYYLISLAVNVGHARVRPGPAPPAGPRLPTAPSTRRSTSSCRSAASRPTCCATPGTTSAGWPDHYPGRVHVYVLDDSATDEREAMALRLRLRLPAPPQPGLVQEGRQHAVRVPAHAGRAHPGARRRLHPPARHARRDAALPRRRTRTSGSSSPRSTSGCTPGRAGWSAAPARCRSCSTGGAGVPAAPRGGDLRRQLRALPAGGAGRDRRLHADRALRGRPHRVRHAPARLAAALPPGAAGHRPVPGRRRARSSPSSTAGAPAR